MKVKLDIRKIQAINLFEYIMNIKATYCFSYNNYIVFTIPVTEMKKIKKYKIDLLEKKLNCKIKIIPSPKEKNFQEICKFIKALVPYAYKKIYLKNKEITFFIPSSRAKAMFIGKSKIRLKQLQSVLEKFFEIKTTCVK
ncbi:MAG: hypothetical protein QXP53_02425 [Candidatus Pacearchaeota archaeon]